MSTNGSRVSREDSQFPYRCTANETSNVKWLRYCLGTVASFLLLLLPAAYNTPSPRKIFLATPLAVTQVLNAISGHPRFFLLVGAMFKLPKRTQLQMLLIAVRTAARNRPQGKASTTPVESPAPRRRDHCECMQRREQIVGAATYQGSFAGSATRKRGNK